VPGEGPGLRRGDREVVRVAVDHVALEQELGNPELVDDVTGGQVQPEPARSPGIISAAGQQIRGQQNARRLTAAAPRPALRHHPARPARPAQPPLAPAPIGPADPGSRDTKASRFQHFPSAGASAEKITGEPACSRSAPGVAAHPRPDPEDPPMPSLHDTPGPYMLTLNHG
jgi:hypothetical protein